MRAESFQRLLKECPIFAPAPESAATTLAVHLERRTYRRGDLVYAERQPANRLFIIAEGKVLLTRTACDGGNRLTLSVRGPAEIFGEMDFLGSSVRVTSAVAATELSVLAIGRRRMRKWIRRHPEVSYALLRALSQEQRRLYGKVVHQRCADLPAKLARLLLECWRDFGGTEQGLCTVELGLTHLELARQIGACRDQVTKTMSDFRRKGWIRVEGRKLFIVAPEELTRYATER